MPDPIIMSQGIATAAVVAALLFLIIGRPWNAPAPVTTSVGGATGAALGVAAGAWTLNLLINLKSVWQPTEDVHRLLLIVLPAAVLVELIAAIPQVPGIVAWVLRGVVAVGVTRVLLHGSIMITDMFGPGSAEWNETQRLQVFGGLGAGIVAVQAALLGLAYRRPSRALPVALSFTAGGAALAVMLSGYATGGQMGLALGGALIALAVTSVLMKDVPNFAGALAVGVVVLASVLISGRFFGELTDAHLVMLLAAPLLCWATELPGLAKLGPKTRGAIQAALVAAMVGFVVFQAAQRFDERSHGPASSESSSAPAEADWYK